MSSARSVAAARAKRATPSSDQSYARPGPTTSINSQPAFNNVTNTTGANARIHGVKTTSNVQSTNSPSSSSTLFSASNDPTIVAAGSKLTVGNAIGLITLRLGRVEAFMHNYQLEGPSTNNSVDNNIMQSVLTRLSVLEKEKGKEHTVNTYLTTSKTDVVDNTFAQMILTRLNTLEKNIGNSSSKNDVTLDYSSLNEDVASLREELKETKDLLLKLQSFTMETNSRLVDTIFNPTEQFNIHEFTGYNDANSEYNSECNFELTTDANSNNILVEKDSKNATMVSGNLKDIINQELANTTI